MSGALRIESECAAVGGLQRARGMVPRVTRINRDRLHRPPGYHHITVVESGRAAFLAGQSLAARCDAGYWSGAGDIGVQIDQVVSDAAIALASVGAQPGQVVGSVVNVVSDDTAALAASPGVGSSARSLRRRSPPRDIPCSAL